VSSVAESMVVVSMVLQGAASSEDALDEAAQKSSDALAG
jgi:hypothetical protein